MSPPLRPHPHSHTDPTLPIPYRNLDGVTDFLYYVNNLHDHSFKFVLRFVKISAEICNL